MRVREILNVTNLVGRRLKRNYVAVDFNMSVVYSRLAPGSEVAPDSGA